MFDNHTPKAEYQHSRQSIERCARNHHDNSDYMSRARILAASVHGNVLTWTYNPHGIHRLQYSTCLLSQFQTSLDLHVPRVSPTSPNAALATHGFLGGFLGSCTHSCLGWLTSLIPDQLGLNPEQRPRLGSLAGLRCRSWHAQTCAGSGSCACVCSGVPQSALGTGQSPRGR